MSATEPHANAPLPVTSIDSGISMTAPKAGAIAGSVHNDAESLHQIKSESSLRQAGEVTASSSTLLPVHHTLSIDSLAQSTSLAINASTALIESSINPASSEGEMICLPSETSAPQCSIGTQRVGGDTFPYSRPEESISKDLDHANIKRGTSPLVWQQQRGTLVWQHEQGTSPWDTFKLVQTLTSTYNTVVNVVIKKQGGPLYVMKSLQQQQLNQPNSTMKEMQNEQDKLKLVDHPNIVKVCTCDHDSLLVLMAGVVHVLCSL
jgi:hypothetical protein